MSDFFEVDFLKVEAKKSGDAITLRHKAGDKITIYVVDGGFQSSGQSVAEHIEKYYGSPTRIDHVVGTHPDGDHLGGLRTVIETFDIGALWLLRPWNFANEIIDRFERFTNVDNLIKRLKEIYPNVDALERIANDRGIPIYDPFQGAKIGAFTVLAPTKARYLDLIVESDKTPESVKEKEERESIAAGLREMFIKATNYIRSAWGDEVFSPNETSAENEMSVVQYANLVDRKIVLTGDAGRVGMTEAADYASLAGLFLPGVNSIQIPHHGSRRNVSTEVLDRWFGERLPSRPAEGEEIFTAICSSAEEDTHHPKKSVIRAFHHRGAKVLATEGKTISTGKNAPSRDGWVAVTPMPYPEEQEE